MMENIYSVFHYLSLHKSEFYKDKYNGPELPNSDHFSDCLIRLPMYYDLSEKDIMHVVKVIKKFYNGNS